MNRWLLLPVALALVAGCSTAADTATAEQGVALFHEQFNSGQFDQIYDSADAEYKSTSTRAESTEVFAGIRGKLGAFRSGKTLNWTDNVNSGGHYVNLTREVQFDRGGGQEAFSFKITANKPVLVGYNITSNALITN